MSPSSSACRRLLASSLALALATALARSAATGSSASPPAGEGTSREGRLLRFPALSSDAIAFVYAGDIWTVARTGGLARQLTTDRGIDWFPRFSPDGRWIAFTGQYDGNTDVYVVPAEGGEPRRLTFWTDGGHPSERSGPNNLVMGWTPDSQRVLFRSRHQAWETRAGRLYTVGLDGALPVPLAVPEGGLASFSPDGKRIVYNRIFRNFRTWKRYRGGMTQNLWIYDLAANTIEQLTENDNNSTDPMWVGNTITFTSDREHTANVYSIDLGTRQTKKLTNHAEYDVRWATSGPGGVVYENGGYVYLLDSATGGSSKVSIRVPSDLDAARTEFVQLSNRITEYALAPDGKRALFVARGEVLTVPAEKGNTRNLTGTSGAHERGAAWSPDGKWIAYLSDVTGEEEIWIASQDGKEPARRLTRDGHCWRFGPAWSPDAKKIAFADKDLKLFVVDVASGKVTLADQAKEWEISDYVWSPDSRWLAYTKQDPQQLHQVYLYSLESAKGMRVTSEMNDSYGPAFDPDGRYLYFLSDRDLNATIGAFDFSYVYSRPTKVYALTLRKDLASPFAPESDEVGAPDEKAKDEGEEKKDKDKEKKKKEVVPLRIDLDGIEERIAVFPMESGNLGALRASSTIIFYLSGPVPTLTGAPEPTSFALRAFDLKKRKDGVLQAEVGGYELSADGTKVLYSSKDGKQFRIIDAKPASAEGGGPPPVKPEEGLLKLDQMWIRLDHRAEWKQIFDEAWRLERDFFYVPNMHGVDWQSMKERYGALLPHVGHRSDLTYLIGEMIGELNAGHTYVGGGDAPSGRAVPIALLGADYELDAATGRYRIGRILAGQNWIESRRSPLTEPGVAVKPGTYLLRIDGAELRSPQVPDDLLQQRTGGTVTLLLNDRPTEEGSREVTVRPLADEEDLRYFDRIEANRKKVEAATDGKVGYVHIPNMGGDGLNEFVRQYYPQIRKQGLIVDVRNNGGGFVSQLIIERLRRVLAGMGNSRNGGIYTYPAQVFHGPMVCLINHYSASDGDIFPYYFKKYGLGPLIGTRTWGGVVGIRGYSPLVDGGYVTRPEFGEYSLDGRWVIEGHGVDPDIEVDNRDDLVARGRDPQLEKGVDVVMEEIRRNPKALPPPPPPPVKN